VDAIRAGFFVSRQGGYERAQDLVAKCIAAPTFVASESDAAYGAVRASIAPGTRFDASLQEVMY
jgi:hypothetical protein